MAKKKGKKLWRTAIDAEQVREQTAAEQAAQWHGLAAAATADADLFYIDKTKDEAAAAAALQGSGTARGGGSRRQKGPPKLLRTQAILQAPQRGTAVPHPRPKLRRQSGAPAAPRKGPARAPAGSRALAQPRQRQQQDLWADEGVQQGEGLEAGFAAVAAARKAELGGTPAPKRRRLQAQPQSKEAVPGVAVDGPGCSYNPDPTQHQEALAAAVAAELHRAERAALSAAPGSAPPRHVDWRPEEDELALLQVDDSDVEGEGAEANEGPVAGSADAPPAKSGTGDSTEGAAAREEPQQQEGAAPARRPLPGKKTRTDRNREGRRREQEAAAAARAELKAARRQLQALPQLAAQLAVEQVEHAALLARRRADRAEAARGRPARLGRLRFTPAPLQVQLSEEVSGSLRQLRGAPLLLQDRYRALQERGFIEPRAKQGGQRATRNRVQYTAGEKGWRERAEQAALDQGRRAQKKRPPKAVL